MEMVTDLTAKHFRLPGGSNVQLLTGMHEEVTELLITAHEYFNNYGRSDSKALKGQSSLWFSSEMTRITMRLSSIMAWLLVRKAVLNEELTEEEARHEEFRLANREVCLARNPRAANQLPGFLTMLSDKSLALYQRVDRLDRMLDQEQATEQKIPHAVH